MNKDKWNYSTAQENSLASLVLEALDEESADPFLIQYISFVLKEGEQSIRKHEYRKFLECAEHLLQQYIQLIEMQMQPTPQKKELLLWLYGELEEVRERRRGGCVVKSVEVAMVLVGGKAAEAAASVRELENSDDLRTHLKKELYSLLSTAQ